MPYSLGDHVAGQIAEKLVPRGALAEEVGIELAVRIP
jgi:hypothetical protein